MIENLRRNRWHPGGLICLLLPLLFGTLVAPAHGQDGIVRLDTSPAPVTLSAQDLDIREALAMISRSRNLNIIYEENVSGRISLDLRNVPFQEALRAVVSMAGYDVVRKGNIYFVRQPASGTRESILTEVHTLRLDFANPDDVIPVVAPMLSPVGKVMSYPPLRTLVVEDRSDVIERIAQVIANLDQPPRQVLIEAQIIEARLSNDLRFGIDWSLVFSSGNGAGNVVASGFAAPAAAGSKGLFVSWAEGDFMARLEALEGVDEVHTVASPRLLAVDGSEAEIIIGGQLGYTVVTTYDRAVMESVEFLDTGAQLRIRPTITGDGKVLMNIHPELSDGVIEKGLPSKTTAQVTTDVLVEDGQTLLIGGLIQTREEVNRKGIPILMNIPLIGALFGQTVRSQKRSELITLITPTIVEPGETPPYKGIGLLSSDDMEPWSGKEDVE